MVKGDDFNATIPGFWVMGALLAWAIHWRWKGGLVAAAAALRGRPRACATSVTQANYGNVFLLMIGGPIVGYLCDSLQRMAVERDGPSGRRRPPRSGPGWPAPSTTACSRCWRWCSAGPELGGDAPSSAGWPGSRRARLRSLIRQQDSLRRRRPSEPSTWRRR